MLNSMDDTGAADTQDNQRSLRKHAIPMLDEDELLRLEDQATGLGTMDNGWQW